MSLIAPVRTRPPLLVAVVNNNIPLVKQLIAAKENVNERGKIEQYERKSSTPLYIASKDGKTDIVKLLLEAGADANIPGEVAEIQPPFYTTPLGIAVNSGHEEIVTLLLKAGADVNKGVMGINNVNKESTSIDTTPLILAVDSEVYTNKTFLKLIKILIAAGADINMGKEFSNTTPLYYAALNNFINAVKVLLDAGASVEQRIGNKLNTSVYELAMSGKTFKPAVNKFILEYVEKKRQRAANVSSIFRGQLQNKTGAPLFPETDINPAGRLPSAAANLIAEFNTGLVRRQQTPSANGNQGAAAGGHGGGRRKIRKTRKGKKATRRR